MAEWKFIPKNDELLISKPWLKFYPEEGIIAPGESSVIKANLYFAPESIIGMPDTRGSMVSFVLFSINNYIPLTLRF